MLWIENAEDGLWKAKKIRRVSKMTRIRFAIELRHRPILVNIQPTARTCIAHKGEDGTAREIKLETFSLHCFRSGYMQNKTLKQINIV